MKRFRITPRASADIDEIWTYIAQDNPAAADRVEQSLHDAMHLLAEKALRGFVVQSFL
jgi:plasmid stabilization system protein ParE